MINQTKGKNTEFPQKTRTFDLKIQTKISPSTDKLQENMNESVASQKTRRNLHRKVLKELRKQN